MRINFNFSRSTMRNVFLFLDVVSNLKEILLGLVLKPEIECQKFASRLDVRD